MRTTNPWDDYFASLGAPLREEVRAFESLGQNCEFAFVQHGALNPALLNKKKAVPMHRQV
ncbi:MAG: hypothetical protein KGH75_02585 [Rhodospirillales bacterium]|nr:hypothetical protein [Rhodospirillales bacterium]